MQSPELSSPSLNIYDEVIEKYPVGDGRLLKVTSLLDGYNSQNYDGDDNDGDDNDDYRDY